MTYSDVLIYGAVLVALTADDRQNGMRKTSSRKHGKFTGVIDDR